MKGKGRSGRDSGGAELDTGPAISTPAQVEIAGELEAVGLQFSDLIPARERDLAAWVIPRGIVSSGAVSHAAQLVYAVLYSLRTGKRTPDGGEPPDPFPGQKYLARQTGLSISQVRKCTRELEQAGLVATHKFRRGLYKTGIQYSLLQVKGIHFIFTRGGVHPVKHHLRMALLFIPRWIAIRAELSPVQKILYSLACYHAGIGEIRRDYARLDTVKLAAHACIKGGRDARFPARVRAMRAVQNHLRTLKALRLLTPFGGGRVAFLQHAWRTEWITELLPREMQAREARRAEFQRVEKVENLRLAGRTLTPYSLLLEIKAGGDNAVGEYTREGVKAVREIRRGRRISKREADPLHAEIRALADGALSAAAGGLNTDQARRVREDVLSRAVNHARDKGAEGRALVAAVNYAREYLDRVLAAEAVGGAR